MSHYDVGISSISDNYITDVINTFHETHLPYILQWSEQNIVLDTAAADHHGRLRHFFTTHHCFRSPPSLHMSLTALPPLGCSLPCLHPHYYLSSMSLAGKRWARTQFEGAELLKWRYTVFNAAGQSAVVANTEGCSMYDMALVAAHRRQRRAAAFWRHPPPTLATCDNPAKDGAGLAAAVWAGDGKREFLFPGTTIAVATEGQCDVACAYLEQFTELGFDAENVAYLDGTGVNSDKAACVQVPDPYAPRPSCTMAPHAMAPTHHCTYTP